MRKERKKKKENENNSARKKKKHRCAITNACASMENEIVCFCCLRAAADSGTKKKAPIGANGEKMQ